ncbi:MAG: hypothetical protein R6U13_10165 [Desulfatiglandaceae bacterium]
MNKDTTSEGAGKELGKVIHIDEGKIEDHLGQMVRKSVDEPAMSLKRGLWPNWTDILLIHDYPLNKRSLPPSSINGSQARIVNIFPSRNPFTARKRLMVRVRWRVPACNGWRLGADFSAYVHICKGSRPVTYNVCRPCQIFCLKPGGRIHE